MDRKYAEYLLQKTQEDYNQIADDFSRYREKPWEEARFLFDNYIKSGDKVLDLGCGSGQYFEFLKDKNVEYVGVDFSEELIKIARKKYPEAKFQTADALNLPFSDDYFDKVYAIALLHNIPSKEFRIKALKEVKRVLKKRGLLIFTVWNLWQKRKTRNLIYKFTLLKILGKSKLDFKDILMNWQNINNCYLHCFTKNELIKLVKEVGFNIIKIGKFLVGRTTQIRSKLPNSNFYIIAEKYENGN
jgi:ubiquinone/menaquinone biosynthesis C-methylase UbiE